MSDDGIELDRDDRLPRPLSSDSDDALECETTPKRAPLKRNPYLKVKKNHSSRERTALIILDRNSSAANCPNIEMLWARGTDTAPLFDGTKNLLCGVATFSWFLYGQETPVTDPIVADLLASAQKNKHAHVLGHLEYAVKNIFLLDGPFTELPDYEIALPWIYAPTWMREVRNRTFDNKRLAEICDVAPLRHYFMNSYQLVELLIKQDTRTLQVVPITRRQRAKILPKFPTAHYIRTWVREHMQEKLGGAGFPGHSDSLADDEGELERPRHLLKLPFEWKKQARKVREGQPTYDAVKTYKFLKFSRHLKDLAKSHTAMDLAICAACHDNDELLDDVATNDKKTGGNMQRTAHQRARLKLDAVSMNLERREFCHIFKTAPDSVQSAHVYSDGSPVTGSELQGMILQLVMVYGVIRDLVMPGVMLHYSFTSALDKCLAFVHSLVMMVGIELEILNWICGKIKSITTDNGIELKMLDCPNILAAYLRRLAGVPASALVDTIDKASRLFSRALRLGDWSHMFANLVKSATKAIPHWPKLLQMMRSLLSFFRNGSWRKHLARYIGTDTARKKLKSFTASLAKWRYETLFDVLDALLNVGNIAQNYLVRIDVVFPNFKDRSLLADVREAAAASDLWYFMRLFLDVVVGPLERSRRWGLACPCHEQDRLEKKSYTCNRNGRRLHQARNFVELTVNSLGRRGRNLNLADCGGIDWIHQGVSLAARRVSAELAIKGHHLKRTPALMSEADDPLQAIELHRQLSTTPDEKLDSLSQYYKQVFLDDLMVRPGNRAHPSPPFNILVTMESVFENYFYINSHITLPTTGRFFDK